MFRSLTTTWPNELSKQQLLAAGNRTMVDFLFPVRSGGEAAPGSNAWVLSGAHTASGKPILANDPHLEFSLPGVWYQVHLEAPGLNVAGASLPGLPGVIVGHNQRIAWGMTNLHYDVQDLYVEQLDLPSGRYRVGGGMLEAAREPEPVRVRGARSIEVMVLATVHGPIVLSDSRRHMALRWSGAEPGFEFPFLQLNRAGNWGEFLAALERFPGPAQNFVYADVDGNIGYQAAGRLPIRKSHDGDLPVDGASGEFEWRGTIPFAELPRTFNPPSGVIVTANQNPFPPDGPHRIHGNFAPHYRSNQIRMRLESRKTWRAADMPAIQKDVYSAFSHWLARQAVAAVDRQGGAQPAVIEAARLLRNWNGQMAAGQAAPLVAALFYQHLRKAVAERAAPGNGSQYDLQMAPAVLERLLSERPRSWFPDYETLLRAAFTDAVEEGMRIQGRNPANWSYGRQNELLLKHPVVGDLPLVGNYFRLGPVPMSGSPTTVNQVTRRLGPSMRFVADLADWDRSLMNLTTGQSGQVLSAHHKDQWEAYLAGRPIRMPFSRLDAKATLEIEPESAAK